VERALILSENDELDTADFRLTTEAATTSSTSLNLEANERRMVTEALEKTGGNISHAAAALGITRAALYRRIEKFDL
jgi:transcriptional regulator of acetoin/glycerol metabolism